MPGIMAKVPINKFPRPPALGELLENGGKVVFENFSQRCLHDLLRCGGLRVKTDALSYQVKAVVDLVNVHRPSNSTIIVIATRSSMHSPSAIAENSQ